MSVNSKMTAIADNLRTLMGGTEKLGLDAMAQKGTDANAAMAAIIEAIEGKGSTVPSGTKLGGLAALVEAIESGGSGSFAECSVTPAADELLDGYKLNYDLGAIPNLLVFFSDDAEAISGARYLKGFILYCPDVDDRTTYMGALLRMSSTSATSFSLTYSNNRTGITGSSYGTGSLVYKASESSVYLAVGYSPTSNGYTSLQAGKTYKLLVGVI